MLQVFKDKETKLILHPHSRKKAFGMLNMIINEGKFGEIPLSFNFNKLSKFLRAGTMKKEKM